MTSDDEAFLRAIAAAPNDVAPRLIYADWLDEQDDPRGEFIRVAHRYDALDHDHADEPRLRQRLQELQAPLSRVWLARFRCQAPTMTTVTWADPLSEWTATASGATITGPRRETNQDAFVLDPKQPFAFVLDGMGGSPAGENAATLAASFLRENMKQFSTAADATTILSEVLNAANLAVQFMHTVPESRGCGVTVAGAVLWDSHVTVTWAGDVMAYWLSGDTIRPLTWVHDSRTFTIRHEGLSEEEAQQRRWRNVLVHYLGGELPTPLEMPTVKPRSGDRLVLASDGLHVMFKQPELLAACQQHSDSAACVEHLICEALYRGSSDNITCVVVDFAGSAEEPRKRRWWSFGS